MSYKSEIVFVLEGENGGGGGIADIASSLGIGSSMGVSSSLFSGENFKELLKTKAIYRKAILTKVKFGGKEDIFGNFFLTGLADKISPFKSSSRVESSLKAFGLSFFGLL